MDKYIHPDSVSSAIKICPICGEIYEEDHVCDVSPVETHDRRLGREACVYSILCREDKEQLDRIEEKLDLLIGGGNG